MSEDLERRHDARAKVAEAASAWVTQNDGCEGYMVTGYVMVVEYMHSGGNYGVSYVTGDGRPPDMDDDDLAGLAEHRVKGLLLEALDDIRGGGGETE